MDSEYSPEIRSIMKGKNHWLLSWGNVLLVLLVSLGIIASLWIPFAEQVSAPMQFDYSEQQDRWLGRMTIPKEDKVEIKPGLEVLINNWNTSGVIEKVHHSETEKTINIQVLMGKQFPEEMGNQIGIAQIKTTKRSLVRRITER